MMRHVSVFRLRPECRTPEIIHSVAEQLRALPQKLGTITGCEIGVKPFPMPSASPDGAVQFYDLIQIITFATEADCMAYPLSQAHGDFLAFSSQYMEQVIALDSPVD